MPTSFASKLAITLLLAQVGIAAPQPLPDQQISAIKGIVSDSVTGQDLRTAFVRLVGKGGTYPAVTDANGKFELVEVAPGTYDLVAEHQGFIEAHLGDLGQQGPNVQLRLDPGQTLTGINIKLTPQAVISGRVVDEDGDVWIHGQVNLLRSEFVHGRRKLVGFSGSDVDDLGQFRIGQLPPGRYYLSAEPDARWEQQNHPRAKGAILPHQPTWYPSGLEFADAVPIVIGPAQQVSGLEIRLHRGGVHSIRGVLTGGENVPSPSDDRLYGRRGISARTTSDGVANEKGGILHSDGSFEVNDLPAGTFEVRVGQGFPRITIGSATVRIDDRDVPDVSIPLVPPRSVNGRIQMEGSESIKPSGLTIQLESLSSFFNSSTVSRPDGSFELSQVGSERYRVLVSGNGTYVKEVRYGDVVTRDATVSLTGAVETLVLTLSTRGAHVTGKVIQASGQNTTTSRPQVALIPNDLPSESKQATFDQNGTFSLENLRPGKYKFYAFEGVPDGSWEDPDFMKEISGKGLEILLSENDVKAVEVPMLPGSDLAPILKKLGME